MNAADAVHCSGCGRDLGLEPIAVGETLQCPECRVAMLAFDCGPGALHDCGRCGAQFVEHAALRDLIERHDRYDVPVARPQSGGLRPDGPVHYIACPVCHSMMNRKNFGAGSGIIVDVCSKHGTWFDSGELPRVLAFVEFGGLNRIRLRDSEERERQEREQTAATARTMSEPYAPSPARESIVMDLLNDLFGL
jgi:Zn-finger nucleic acid-binding protein